MNIGKSCHMLKKCELLQMEDMFKNKHAAVIESDNWKIKNRALEPPHISRIVFCSASAPPAK